MQLASTRSPLAEPTDPEFEALLTASSVGCPLPADVETVVMPDWVREHLRVFSAQLSSPHR